MGDVVIKVPPIVLHISPLGFHHYAAEFLRAATGLQITADFSPVPYYLFSRSIELALKAFLLAKGFPKRKLKHRSIGHDLEKALKKAVSLGLHDIVVISSRHTDELKKANNYYASKGFEYFKVVKAVTGYRNLPDLAVLSDLASILVSKLEPICFQATDGPI